MSAIGRFVHFVEPGPVLTGAIVAFLLPIIASALHERWRRAWRPTLLP